MSNRATIIFATVGAALFGLVGLGAGYLIFVPDKNRASDTNRTASQKSDRAPGSVSSASSNIARARSTDDPSSSKLLSLLELPDTCKGNIANTEAREQFDIAWTVFGLRLLRASIETNTAGTNYRAYAMSNDASALAQANASANAATSLKRQILDARFVIADSSLAAGCLDIADEAYKNIIISYSASEEAGIRDRAKVGIDEVRDKRMRASR